MSAGTRSLAPASEPRKTIASALSPQPSFTPEVDDRSRASLIAAVVTFSSFATRFACFLPTHVINCNRAVRKNDQPAEKRAKTAVRRCVRARARDGIARRPVGDARAARAGLWVAPFFGVESRPSRN